MPTCKFVIDCNIFFNGKIIDMPNTASLMKEKYCNVQNSDCARFTVASALRIEAVPADLFPGNQKKAKALIDKEVGE